MSRAPFVELREKTEKLKAHNEAVAPEVTRLKHELQQHQQTVSRLDIEMSVLHDAFREKFPGVSDQERDSCLSAMEHLQEIERLESVLAQEQRQTSWHRGEMQRLSGLAPTKPVADVDSSDLVDQQKRVAEDLQALRVRNNKLEKSLKLSQNKIVATLADVRDLEDRVEERRLAAQANAELHVRAEELARENAELAETFRVENAAMHEIQDQLSSVNREKQEIAAFIDANEETIQESAGVEDSLVQILRALDEANAPMKEIKSRNEEFVQKAAELRQRMAAQLGEIAALIELLTSKV
jgi:predicted nuclease with TOPRIM domain